MATGSEAVGTPVDTTLAEFEDRRANLIPILQQIQAVHSYLPEAALRAVARKLRLPLPDVYQVATFYRCFSLVPRARHVVQVCLGTACHVRGGPKILDRVRLETGVAGLGNSADMEFAVETVRCIGCCGLAPVMKVDRDVHATLAQAAIKRILKRYRPGGRTRADSSHAGD